MRLMDDEVMESLKGHTIRKAIHDKDPVAVVKYFNPFGAGTWYVAGAKKEKGGDWLFYGFVESPIDPLFDEWGYFTLKELESIRTPFGGLERDLYFEPVKVSKIQKP